MKKLIVFIMMLTIPVLGQHSYNILKTLHSTTFDTAVSNAYALNNLDTTWLSSYQSKTGVQKFTNLIASYWYLTAYVGTRCYHKLVSGDSVTYGYIGYIPATNDTTMSIRYRWYTEGYGPLMPNSTTGSWVTVENRTTMTISPTNPIYMRVYSAKSDGLLAGGLNEDIYLDEWWIREILDTLYIDGTNGSDNNYGDASNDAVKTLTEAFETRGAHSGGVFITAAGTYNESITIDASFEYWKAVGGDVSIPVVDFNDKTLKVDYEIWANIGTKKNAGNVTILIGNDKMKVMRPSRGYGWY